MPRILDIYTRVSKASDKRVLPTEGQEIECRARVAAVGAKVGRIFTDPGRSAWNPKVRRPEWEALMARLEAGESDGVVVFDLPRFARQRSDGERLIGAAERGLVILDSGSEYDLTKASGKKAFADAITAAAYYSDMVSESSKRGKRLKAARGEVDAKRSFGFEQDGVTVREDEAAIIRDHARRLLAGETQDSLIKELNETGVPSVRGAKWGYTTYRQIMMRPRNFGLIQHNGEIVKDQKLPGEPILDEGTYHRIVALYASRRRGRAPSGRYVCTGLALCGMCRGALSGRPVYGSNRRIYWCKYCHHVFIGTNLLDDWAADWTILQLRDPNHIEAIERADRETAARRSELLAEQAEVEGTLTEIGGRLGRREISLTRHDAICGPLEARMAEIEHDLEALEAGPPEPPSEPLPAGQRPTPPLVRSHLTLLEEWTEGTDADRRAMLVRALRGRHLVVGPGKSAKFDPSRVWVE